MIILLFIINMLYTTICYNNLLNVIVFSPKEIIFAFIPFLFYFPFMDFPVFADLELDFQSSFLVSLVLFYLRFLVESRHRNYFTLLFISSILLRQKLSRFCSLVNTFVFETVKAFSSFNENCAYE